MDLVVTDQVGADVVAVLGAGLTGFNREKAGYSDSTPLAVLVHDAGGAVVGGAAGRTSLGLLILDLLYLPPASRGTGLGTAVLRRYEEEGRRRGCRNGFLMTISFQAPAFYERFGWVRFGEIPCDPPGTSRVFLQKAL